MRTLEYLLINQGLGDLRVELSGIFIPPTIENKVINDRLIVLIDSCQRAMISCLGVVTGCLCKAGFLKISACI